MADALAALCSRPIAHRGLHACGGAGPVENTIAAAEAAIAEGYGIECDVQLSRDGEAMVFHDDVLDRLTTASGRVDAFDADALRALHPRDGCAIPTLEMFLAAVNGRVPLVIEIKSAGFSSIRLVERTLELTSNYDGAVALESFDPVLVAHCRGAACPIGLVGPAEPELTDPTQLPRCDFLSWNVAAVRRAVMCYPQLPRTAWTVRTPAQQAEALRCGAQIVFEGFRP